MNKDEIKKQRILNLAEQQDRNNIYPPPMNDSVALKELFRYFLGEDFYISDPISHDQVNTQMVYEIEKRYKSKFNKY